MLYVLVIGLIILQEENLDPLGFPEPLFFFKALENMKKAMNLSLRKMCT